MTGDEIKKVTSEEIKKKYLKQGRINGLEEACDILKIPFEHRSVGDGRDDGFVIGCARNRLEQFAKRASDDRAESMRKAPEPRTVLRFYMAHPYQGKPENLVNARLWLHWLNSAVEGAEFVAPWIDECEKAPETPESRADGLRRMRDFIATECDGVLAIWRLTDGVLSELLSHRERWFYGFREPPESWAEFMKYSRKIPSEVYEWNIVPVIFQ